MNEASDSGSNELIQLEKLLSEPSFQTLQPLDQAADVYKSLARLTIIPESDRKKLHGILKDLLFKNYKEKHSLSDLDDAIVSARYVSYQDQVEQREHLSEESVSNLETLNNLLYHRFLRTAAASDIEASIDSAKRVVNATAPSDPRRLRRLDQLANYLYAHYRSTGNEDRLNTSISKSKDALLAAPSSHIKIVCLHNLAVRLFSRFEKSFNADDLDQAQKLNLEALTAVTDGHPYRPELLLNQARFAFARFRLSHFWGELDEATRLAKEAMKAKTSGTMTMLARHQNLSIFYLQSFRISKKAADLSLAHQHATAAVKQSKDLKLAQNIARETLLECLLAAFANNGRLMELRSVMDVLEDQIDDMDESAARHRKIEHYRKLLTLKYEHTGDHVDLVFLFYESLRIVQVEASWTSNPEERAECRRKIDSLTFLLGELFRLYLVPEFIDVRVALMTSIHNAFLEYKAEGIPGALTSFLKKLEIMSFRLDVYGNNPMEEKDSIIGPKRNRLNKIAAIMEQARVNARTKEDPVPLSQFRYRLLDFMLQFPPEEKIDLQDARTAISQLNGPSESNAGREKLKHGKEYHQLSKALYQRFKDSEKKKEVNALSILEEAIEASKKAMSCFSSGSKEYRDAIGQYVNMNVRRSDVKGSRESTDIAIKAIESALDVLGDDILKLMLCQQLRLRFLQFKDFEDLHRASALVEELLPSIATDLKDKKDGLKRLSIAASVLKSKYQWLGDVEALDKGISYLRHVVEPNSWGNQSLLSEELAQAEMTLGFMLRLRFRRTRSVQDIQEAAQFGRSALAKLERSNASAGLTYAIQNNVGIIFEDLYKRSKRPQDLDEAIRLAEGGNEPLGNINLANRLLLRFQSSANIYDLERAVSLARSAVADMSGHGAHSALVFTDCAEVLLAKYKYSSEPAYLEEAIRNAETGLAQMPTNVPWRSECLLMYANMLNERAVIADGDSTAARKRCIELQEEAWKNECGTPSFRLQAAYHAGRSHCELANWEIASSLLEGAVEYLLEVCPPWMDYSDRQHLLEELSGLAADAAAVALKAGRTAYRALRLLELSRGVIMGSTIDFRRDVSQLAETNPKLERKFNRLRMALDSTAEDTESARGAFYHDSDFFEYGKRIKISENKEPVGIARRIALHKEMTHLLASIREIPGLEDFLNLPKSDTLTKMAQRGPIVFVLCSKAVGVGNAIMVQSTGIEAIELPRLTAAEATKRLTCIKEELPCGSLRTYAARNKDFRDELLWVWQAVVEPILRHNHPDFQASVAPYEMRHIHWIGVGILSCIPFHAAGDHSSGSVSNTISHAISSYASSLRALQYVTKTRSTAVGVDRLLIATMTQTPGAAPLPSAGKELSTIRDVVGESLPTVQLQQPTPPEVLEQLLDYNLIHFACHGISDSTDPFSSRLLLSNPNARYYGSSRKADEPGTLSVHDLLTHRSTKADLAYISACSTADMKVATLADESVHIASAFQLAGFRHVVASLWEQKDSVCLEIAAKFYRELFRLRVAPSDEWPVAEALHNAISEIRRQRPGMVLQWASFVHIGA